MQSNQIYDIRVLLVRLSILYNRDTALASVAFFDIQSYRLYDTGKRHRILSSPSEVRSQ